MVLRIVFLSVITCHDLEILFSFEYSFSQVVNVFEEVKTIIVVTIIIKASTTIIILILIASRIIITSITT